MSKSIDERVVQMQFDNKQFEQGAKTTMSTLDKLKEKLQFKDASKGFKNLDTAAKSVDLSSLSKSIDTIASRFTNMGIIATTALQNITNRAIRAGQQLTNSILVQPITGGFSEYETQLNAVQTILANTSMNGTTLQDVNAALDELNTYADKTIYNFTEMTRNIGTFTAAGVELDTSVQAIKGIANLAAMSGSSSTQASTAMYQLSQALAAGRVSLQDWNSVVNAGMGGKVFQDALKNTAKAMGIVVDESVSFRESISTQGGTDSWLTSEVLLNTLKQFTGDMTDAELATMGFNEEQIKSIQLQAQTAEEAATKVKTFTQLLDTTKEAVGSGWAQTWEIVFGDFGEAKTLWTGISNVITGAVQIMSDARNDLLQASIGNPWSSITEQVSEAGVSVNDFENAVTDMARQNGLDIDSIIGKYGSLSEAFVHGAVSSDIVSRTLKDLITNQEDSIELTDEQVQKLSELGDQAGDTSTEFGHLIDILNRPTGRQNIIDGLAEAFRYLSELAKPVSDAFHSVFTAIDPESIYQATVRFKEFFQSLTVSEETTSKLERTFSGLFNVIKLLIDGVGALVNGGFRVLGKIFGFTTSSVLDFTSVIGDALTSFTDFVRGIVNVEDALDKVSGVVNFVSTSFSNLFSAIQGLPVIQNVGTSISNAFSGISAIVTNAKEQIAGLFEGFDFSTASVEEIRNKITETGSIIGDAFSAIGSIVSGEGGLFTDLSTAFDSVSEYLSEKFDGILEIIGGFIDAIKETFSGIGLENIMALGFGIGLIATLRTINKTLKTIQTALKPIANIVKSIKNYLSNISKAKLETAKAEKFKAIADILKSVAIVIGTIAASVAVLSMLDPTKMQSAALTLGILSGALIGITALVIAVSKKMDEKDILKTSTTMVSIIGLALGISAVVNAFNDIQVTSLTDVLIKLGIVAALAVILGGVAVAVNKFGAVSEGMKRGKTSLLGMVGVAAAIWLVVQAFKDISDFNGQAIIDNLGALITVFGILAVVSLAASKVKFTSGTGLLLTVGSIAAFVAVIDSMSKLDYTAIKKNLGEITTIFGLFAGVMIASHFAGNNVLKAGVGILAMSSSILIIAEGMKQIASISDDDMERSGTIVLALFGIFTAITAASKLVGKDATKAGVMILAMSASLVLISVAMHIINTMEDADIVKATAVVSVLLILMGGLVAVSKFAGGTRAAKVMTSMNVTLGIMVASVAILSMIEPSRLAGATAAMTILIAVFSLAMYASKYAQGSVGSLVVMVVAVGLIGAVLTTMSMLNVENAIQNAIGISTLLLAMTAAMTIASKIPIVGAVQGALAIGAFAAIVIAIGSLIAVIAGALGSISGAQDLLATAVTTLSLVGQAIGAFIGGIMNQIIGNAMSAITSGLPDLGAALSAFAVNITPFIATMKTVDLSALAGASRVLLMVGEMLGAEVLGLIADFLNGDGNSLAKFGQEMIPFAVSVATFGRIIASSDVEAINAGAKVMEALSKVLFTMSGEGGIITSIFGEKDLSSFGTQLKGFGEGLYQFAISVQGITPDMAKNADSALGVAEKLIAMSKTLYGEGGVLQYWLGEKDFGSFGTQVAAFGAGLFAFANSVQGITSEMTSSCESAIEISDKLIELSKNLNASGGALQWWIGEKDFGEFGRQISKYGRSLLSFAESVADITPEMSASCANALIITDALVNISKKLNYSGGVVLNYFLGEKNFGKFGEQIVAYGESLVEFADTVSDITPRKAERAALAVVITSTLVSIGQNIPNTGGYLSVFFGDNDFATFGMQIVAYGNSLVNFANSVSSLSDDDVTAIGVAISATKKLVGLQDSMPKMNGILDYIAGGTYDYSSLGPAIMSLGSGIGSFADSIKGKDFSNVETAVVAISDIASLSDDMPGLTSLWESFTGDGNVDLSTFGTYLTNLGSGLGNFYNSIKDADMEQLSAGITQLTTIASAISGISDLDPTSVENFTASLQTLSGLDFSEMASNLASGAETVYTQIYTIGRTMMQKLQDGIDSKLSIMRLYAFAIGLIIVNRIKAGGVQQAPTISEVITAMITVLNSNVSRFTTAGENAGKGYVDGFKSYASKAAEAAAEIAQSTIDALNSTLDEHSPSRVTAESGKNAVLGFVNELFSGIGMAYSAGESIANGTLDGLRNALALASGKFSQEADYEPVIRPVVDLSEVENGAYAVNSLFSKDRRYNLYSPSFSVGKTAASMNNLMGAKVSSVNTSGSSSEDIKSFNFTQNNYSPKALSRSEIYRQTNNQFTKFKKRVTGH